MGGACIATSADIRTILRLSRKLHTSEDPIAQKKHLIEGLCELLDAHSAISVVAHVERIPRRHTIVSVTRIGHAAMREEQLLGRYLPALSLIPHRIEGQARQRWHPLPGTTRPIRGRRVYDCLRSEAATCGAHIIATLSLTGDRSFNSRDRSLLQLIHYEVSWVYESDLLLATHGASTLTPRQRQTLEFLLAGHSEKQIAEKMRLSFNTVHHHIKALHRHFCVSSRSELLARWVR